MFDDLAAYYHENVVTEFADYRDTSKDGVVGRSKDLRQALVAATALFHLREHLPSPSFLSRRDIEQRCPDYAILGDIVNSAKHRQINKTTSHGAPLVDRATCIAERQIVIEYNDVLGPYRHALKAVIAKQTDGSERHLLEIMTNVINFWEGYLHAQGVLTSAKPFAYDDPLRFRLRPECNGGRLDQVVVRGQRFVRDVQLLRFNEASGRAEPVDLTGATVRGAIYKPAYEFEVSLTHTASGKEFRKAVFLTDSELMELHSLSTDAEREAFAINTQSARDALQELAASAGLNTPKHSRT